jgi:hypothetical protein
MDVKGDTIIRERIDAGLRAEFRVHTTMYSCPNCHVILGVAQYTTY